jgi:HK97 family phage prohead protease
MEAEQRRCVDAANAVLEDGGTDEDAIYACIAAAGKERGTMIKKTYRTPIELKEDGEPGEFRAVFSTFNVIDHDGDVTVPGAFHEGEKVRISYWGHRWQDLPVGRGEIHQDEEKAWVDGRFFLDTMAGKETYLTIKELDELQEWSYGFDIEESRLGEFEEQDVLFLEKLTVHEVSPVMLGAGIGTGTESIKEKGDAGGDVGDSDNADGDEGQTGDPSDPSGMAPRVISTIIEIDLLEVEL